MPAKEGTLYVCFRRIGHSALKKRLKLLQIKPVSSANLKIPFLFYCSIPNHYKTKQH